VKNSLEDPDKLSLKSEDRKVVQKTIDEAQEWLKEHEEVDKSEYQEKLKAVQKICDPLISEADDDDDEDEDESTDEHDGL
jgi:heat shock protein 5